MTLCTNFSDKPFAAEALWSPATSQHHVTTLQLQRSEINRNSTELSSNESAYSSGTSPAAVRPIHILPHPSQMMVMPPVPLSAAEKLKKLKRRHMY